jgi:hypothetical protein
MEELLEVVLLTWSVSRAYKGPQFEAMNNPSCVEARSNTSTAALRVVGGDKKESLESETVKYGHENECAGEDQQQL